MRNGDVTYEISFSHEVKYSHGHTVEDFENVQFFPVVRHALPHKYIHLHCTFVVR